MWPGSLEAASACWGASLEEIEVQTSNEQSQSADGEDHDLGSDSEIKHGDLKRSWVLLLFKLTFISSIKFIIF